MFFLNLNVFVTCMIIASSFAGGALAIFISLLLTPFVGSHSALSYAFVLAYLVVGLVLAWFWWKKGLSPAKRKPERERRFVTGHVLLALTNVILLLTFIVPISIAKISGNSGFGMYALFGMYAVMLGFIAWPVGLFMVWSSRE